MPRILLANSPTLSAVSWMFLIWPRGQRFGREAGQKIALLDTRIYWNMLNRNYYITNTKHLKHLKHHPEDSWWYHRIGASKRILVGWHRTSSWISPVLLARMIEVHTWSVTWVPGHPSSEKGNNPDSVCQPVPSYPILLSQDPGIQLISYDDRMIKLVEMKSMNDPFLSH